MRRVDQHRSNQTSAMLGFTLLELLVVVFMVGVIAAIAAPTWEKLLARQRVTTAREQTVQALRDAQSKARRTRTPQVVYIDPAPGDRPRIATAAYANQDPVNFATITGWQNIGQENIPQGSLQVALRREGAEVTDADQRRVIFDADGAVDRRTEVPLAIVLKGSVSGPGDARCIVIETRLGSLRTAEGNDCP